MSLPMSCAKMAAFGCVLGQSLIFLLLLPAPSLSQIGPDTLISPTTLPFLVQANNSTAQNTSLAVLVSHKYAITSPKFLSGLQNNVKIYSGDFSNPATARVHNITKTMDNGKVVILKFCPKVQAPNHPWILDPATAFDFATNATGKVLFIKNGTSQLYFRTEPVLTDVDCEIDDNRAVPGKGSMNYEAPYMTCTKFDNSPGGCLHLRPTRLIWKTFPVLLVDDKPVAVLRELSCTGTSMRTIATYYKIQLQKTYIAASTDAPAA